MNREAASMPTWHLVPLDAGRAVLALFLFVLSLFFGGRRRPAF